jgi:uncharacterized PurR-regulated membrane protein YhhQ (DUF165 family)
MLLICIITLSLFKKILGELGIKIVFILMSITSFLLTFKYINIWEFNINANCVTYITMFSALYLLLENKDRKETKKIINLNFLLNILCSVIIYISTYHTQSLTDTVGINMKNVFRGIPIILISFPIITLLANYSLTIMYKKIKSLYDNLFITTVTTFLLIGIIEGVLYTLISYYNILTLKIIIELILSTYMIKLILTVIYSIILMKITKKKVIG